MELSLSASRIVASTIPTALVTPFAELEHFISLCDTPTRVLPSSHPHQPHHTFDNSIDKDGLYIVVPTPTKYSKTFPTSLQLSKAMECQNDDQYIDNMVVRPWISSLAFMDPRTYIHLFQQFTYPFITSIIMNFINIMAFAFHLTRHTIVYFFGLLKTTTMTGIWVSVNIARSFWSFFKLIILLIIRPAIITTDIVSRIYNYIDGIPLIKLYLKPIYYLTMLSALVGSAIGFCVGYTIIIIRQLIPTTPKNSEQKLAANSIIKSFKNSLSSQRPNLRLKSHVPSTTKIKSKPPSDSTATTIPTDSIAVIASTEQSKKPTSLLIAIPLNHSDSSVSVSSISSKHKAHTSDYEEENEEIISRSPDYLSGTDQSSNDVEPYVGYTEIPPVTPPLYEDEDGYSNYFIQSSATFEDVESKTPADTPKILSPISEVKRTGSSIVVPRSTLSESTDCYTGVENRNIGDNDTILETLKTPVGKVVYNNKFESITEEGD